MTLGGRILIRNRKWEILLVKHTYIPGWHLPGGGVDYGEDLYEATVRETYEECGIKELRDLKLIKVVINSRVSKRDHVALFTASTSDIPKLRNNLEIKTAKFFSPEDLPIDIDINTMSMIDEIQFCEKTLNINNKSRNYSGDEL